MEKYYKKDDLHIKGVDENSRDMTEGDPRPYMYILEVNKKEVTKIQKI